ncbi:MAG: hypothetical protein WC150_08050 [Bacteroidia bacterium]
MNETAIELPIKPSPGGGLAGTPTTDSGRSFESRNTLVIILILSFAGCTRSIPNDVIQSGEYVSVKTFFDSTFNKYTENYHSHIYKLETDSLNINSLGVTLFSVQFAASHGTDYTVLRDNKNGTFYCLPRNRGYFSVFYDLSTLDMLLSNSFAYGLPPIESMESEMYGLEAFLNQSVNSERFSLNHLDSILQFKKSYELGERINSIAKLDSCFKIVFPQDKQYTKPERLALNSIESKLKAALSENKSLIYFTRLCFNLYQINPQKNSNDSSLKRQLIDQPNFNIRKLKVGVHKQ